VLPHPGGAGVDSRALAPSFEALLRLFRTYAPEQWARGHTPDVDSPVSYQDMAQDTIMFIDSVIGRPVHLLGVSDGAVVALMVALAAPTWCTGWCSPQASSITTAGRPGP